MAHPVQASPLLLGHPLLGAGLAWREAVSTVLETGAEVPPIRDATSIGSNFGHGRPGTIEVLSHKISIDGSAPSIATSAARPVDLVYACGHLLWSLAGSESVEWISYYNPRGRVLSADDQRLEGAPGPRIMGQRQTLLKIVRLLQRDPSTRRAEIPLALEPGTTARDTPCQGALQYFVRSGTVQALTTMRSQSALMLLPYDAFFATALQALVAASLGIEAGQHDYFVASLHVYLDEISQARQLLANDIDEIIFRPASIGLTRLPEVLRFESGLRTAVVKGDRAGLLRRTSSILQTGDQDLWDQMQLILAVDALGRLELDEARQKLEVHLPPEMARALELRKSHVVRRP